MLRLSAEQFDWVLTQQRERLAKALAQVLGTQWPALAAKLGERSAVFVDTALQQAHRCGLTQATHAARYVNLWCVWGPAFDDKAGFEWAADILRDDRRTSAVKIQQLVLQSRDVLVKRAAPGLGAKEFDAADAAMEAVPQVAGVAAWIAGTEMVQAEPRQPCDLTAFDLALGDQSWRSEYRLAWSGNAALISHVPLAAEPQRYRTDTPQPPGTPVAPRQLAVLAMHATRGPKAWLHVRCAVDSVCDERRHPRVEIKSDHGGQTFEGTPARLIKWALYCAPDLDTPPPPAMGLPGNAAQAKPGAPVSTLVTGGGLCREPQVRFMQLTASTCGLRRFGAPLGQQEAMVSIYAAQQWLAEFKTLPQPECHWPAQGARDVATAAQVRLERDAQALPVASWQQGWAQLAPALTNGVDGFFNELTRSEVVLNPRIRVVPNLMHGASAWTWGAREFCTSEGSVGFLRALALVRMVACATEFEVQGELRWGGAHARIHLRAAGNAPLQADVLRDSPQVDLPALLAGVKAAWRFPFVAQVEAQSSPDLASMAQTAASMPGALVGEAGLRPRPDGQGWEWYCQLKLEPAMLALAVTDPMRGVSVVQRTLWPAMTLLDWSAG